MRWAEEVRIETPEQIDVSLEMAGLGSRFVAQVVDWLIKSVATILVVLAIYILAISLGAQIDRTAGIMLLVIGGIVLYVLWLGYDIFYELKKNGQTPGKRIAGIRVIREEGAPLDFQAACIRNLLGLADFLPGYYLLGGLLVLLMPRGQRIGDLAAGTVVIRERVQQHPEAPARVEELASSDFTFTSNHLSTCGAEDRFILRSFFQRYDDMKATARHNLATRLAERFVSKTGYQPAAPIADGGRAEGFLAALYRDLENRAKHDR